MWFFSEKVNIDETIRGEVLFSSNWVHYTAVLQFVILTKVHTWYARGTSITVYTSILCARILYTVYCTRYSCIRSTEYCVLHTLPYTWNNVYKRYTVHGSTGLCTIYGADMTLYLLVAFSDGAP